MSPPAGPHAPLSPRRSKPEGKFHIQDLLTENILYTRKKLALWVCLWFKFHRDIRAKFLADVHNPCWGCRFLCGDTQTGCEWGHHFSLCRLAVQTTTRVAPLRRQTSSGQGCGWRSWVLWRRCPDWTLSTCQDEKSVNWIQEIIVHSDHCCTHVVFLSSTF